EEIKVPTNWWTTPRWSYDKIFRKSRKTNLKGQGYNKRTVNPYCKGWYRKNIELLDLAGGRVQMEFHAIGYEAELYVNGKFVGRHHGDFRTYDPDITEFVQPGKNVIALRVLADLGPHDEIYRHVYGAAWRDVDIKGGLWDHVFLIQDKAQLAIDRLWLTADSSGAMSVEYRLICNEDAPATVIPNVAISFAEDPAPVTGTDFPEIKLKKGENTGRLVLNYPDPKCWDTDHPNLYFCSLTFRDGKNVRAAKIERFGFRDFKAANGRFYLNGKPIYLRMETVQSMGFSGDRGDPKARIEGFKKKGLNILRTAHQPVTPRIYDHADECGMMIYDESALAFLRNIDEKEFIPNTLDELAGFVRRDHNRPSVVMWVLGNEINHRTDPKLRSFLQKQTALVRSIDRQKRPIAAFAGCGNLSAYGSFPLDTDIIDFHLYTGLTRPWSQWDHDFDRLYREAAQVFGKNGKLDKPVVISEAIGGGWGLQPNRKYKHGSIDAYLPEINRAYYWGNPGAAGYSGAIGVKAALDPQRNWPYTQNLNGTRIIEMARQDPRIAGFGTWIAVIDTKNYPRWTQDVYPGLRVSPQQRIAPRQYLTPGERTLDAFLLNQGLNDFASVKVAISLVCGEKTSDLGTVDFGAMKSGERKNKPITLRFDAPLTGNGEIRLTVLADNREIGRNSYPVRLHPIAAATAPIDGAAKVLLADSGDKSVERLLKDLAVPFDRFDGKQNPASYDCLIVPPGAKLSPGDAVKWRVRVENGGRLLLLEQKNGKLPVCGEYSISSNYNTMAEIIVENHPVFDRMNQTDFDIWAENTDGNVVSCVSIPLEQTAIAAKGRFLDERDSGAAIAEAQLGKGRVIISQVDALKLWKINGGATRYLRNLFQYAVKPAALYPDARRIEQKVRDFFPIAHERIVTVDLKKYANRSFRDDVEGDGCGGWTDQGKNDFRNMPLGRQEAAGIPFDIIDPGKNGDKSCIVLKGSYSPWAPGAVNGIKIGQKFSQLFFLHTAAYAGPVEDYAFYRVNYEDGTSVKIGMRGMLNVADWWNPVALPEAVPVLIQQNAVGGRVGCYVSRWENPYQWKKIESIDFVVSGRGAATPILVAMTGELMHPEPLLLLPTTNAKALWGPAADNGGDRGWIKTIRTGNPKLGPYASRVYFPATKHIGYSAAIFSFFPDLNRLRQNNYDYLSFWYRSDDTGMVDFILPQAEHRSRLGYSFDLGKSKGKWVFLRLSLKYDFTLGGAPFEIQDMRKELIFYNGWNKAAGFPRKAVTFDITDIRLE
ncbi:MAG: glycoside hydrolase family 2 TIM barrel-domain containing protein, partial [Victivallaceae bacterium]|nr:glycoside hydrolase family 2 TIM barrel-domain containing protein [Victivallaceae bacterium]